MSQFEYIKFVPEHAYNLKPGRHHATVYMPVEYQLYMYQKLQGITLLLNGEICAIMGVVPLHEGVGEVFFMPTDTAYRHMRQIIADLKQWLQIGMDIFNMHRLQATVLADKPHLSNFVRRLGFVYEGHMYKYGIKQEDVELWALF